MLKFYLDRLLIYKMVSKCWLSKQTEIDINTITAIYNNEVNQIKLETLEKICNSLHCEISDLIKYTHDSNEKVG